MKMRHVFLFVLLSATISSLVETAMAQDPLWNRRIRAMSIQPTAVAGQYDVTIPAEIMAANPGTILDLSSTLSLSVNGIPVSADLSWDINLDQPNQDCEFNCGSDCGSLYVDNVINTMTCHEDGPGDCDCGHWLTAEFPGVELEPGDEISAFIFAAAGALPEDVTDDDRLVQIFDGTPSGWNRRGVALAIEPVVGEDSLYELSVLWDCRAQGLPSELPLSTQTELRINGDPVLWLTDDIRSDAPGADCEFNCGTGCGGIYVDNVINTMTCRLDGPDDCDCGYWIQTPFPPQELQPGDEIMVILRPAPGALPETNSGDNRLVHDFTGAPIGWAREINSVAVVAGSAPGLWDITAAVDITGSGVGRPLDLSTLVGLRIDGVPQSSELAWQLVVDAPGLDCEFSCGSSCGGLYVDGMINTMTCRLDGPGDCDCGYWIQANFPDVPAPNQGEILIFAGSSDGAAANSSGVDTDIYTIDFTGLEMGFNRSIQDVQVVEVSPEVYDVIVDVTVAAAQLTTFHDLSFDLRVWSDEIVLAEQTVQMQYLPPDPGGPLCPEDCSDGACGFFITDDEVEIAAECLVWPGFEGCSCGIAMSLILPAVQSVPGGYSVSMTPVPGALPELPPLEDDDLFIVNPQVAVGDSPRALNDQRLDQNHPNPFNPRTTITYRTATSGPVVLEIFDTRGQRVRRLVDEIRSAGTWRVSWDGRNDQGSAVASGHYVYRLRADGQTESRKMTLLK